MNTKRWIFLIASAMLLSWPLLSAWAQPNVDIVVTGVNYPYLIPPEGGDFPFVVALYDSESIQVDCDVWMMAYHYPAGHWFGPVYGPLSMVLEPNSMIARMRFQEVPANAPPGSYMYWGYVGDFPGVVWDSSGFPFKKMAGEATAAGFKGWICTGERSPAEFIPSCLNLDVSPNPFNPATAIRYQLADASPVKLTVWDSAGRLVATLVDGQQEAGEHQATFDGSKLASGMYLYILQTGDQMANGKMMLIK